MIFKPQKVLHLKDELAKKNPKLQGEYAITEKHNGWDIDIPFDGEKFLPFRAGRSGQEKFSLSWVHTELNASLKTKSSPFVLKGEAVQGDTPFEILNGLLNRKSLLEDVQFKLHNLYLPSAPDRNYLGRRDSLINIHKVMLSSEIFQITPILYTGKYDQKVWDSIFEDITQDGGEGIVAARTTALYSQGKRNSDVLKMKLECTVDVLADRLEETIGKKGNPALTLVSKRKNGTEVRTIIGRHSLQEQFRTNPSSVLGKVVAVHGMYEYPDGKIKEPVFGHIRYDKLPNDIN